MEKYLEFAKEVALKAGDVMLKHFSLGIEIEWKSDNTPVTVADKAINSMLIREVNQRFPSHSVLGEEESSIIEDAEYTWVCDPIDGTVPYTIGIPISCFSLALVKDGQPILGVAYDPYMKRLYHAVKGQGAFLNDKKISVNKKSDLYATGIYGILDGSRSNMIDVSKVRDKIVEIGIKSPRLYCVVQSGMLTAVGTIDFVIAPLKTTHDIAAIKIIVEESGGKVTDIAGNEQSYGGRYINGALISNGLLHDQILELIQPYLSNK